MKLAKHDLVFIIKALSKHRDSFSITDASELKNDLVIRKKERKITVKVAIKRNMQMVLT